MRRRPVFEQPLRFGSTRRRVDAGAARQLVDTFLFDGWNSHDPDRLLACVTRDVVWQDTSLPNGIVHGHDSVRARLLSMWQTSAARAVASPESVADAADSLDAVGNGAHFLRRLRITTSTVLLPPS